MKKIILWALLCLCTQGLQALPSHRSEPLQEKLGRGLVAFNTKDRTTFISWRFFNGEQVCKYRLYRNGQKLVETERTSHTLPVESALTDVYQLEVLNAKGEVIETTGEAKPFNQYLKIQLVTPDPTVVNNSSSYTPNDMSIGDIDNDGEMELFVKWDPENSKDSSNSGKTANVIIDCYRMDGTRMWSVNLGPNIRAGAHYTQFLVYDFDGDGCAEMMCKTAPWSKDGKGNYVSAAADDEAIRTVSNTVSHRNGSGHIAGGPEFLTVFDGKTGAAVHTTWYNPDRGLGINAKNLAPEINSGWGDAKFNRSERYNACVAYLDGINPSAVFCRGYYNQAFLWAVDYQDKKLVHRWLHASTGGSTVSVYDANWNKTDYSHTSNTRGTGSNTCYANGNHNLSVGDYDGDGNDEICLGSSAVDHDGRLLYATGYGHGDAIHVSDLIPSRPGLEVFEVHEKGNFGWDIHDARTGEIIWAAEGGKDNGRGMAADLIADNPGFEFSSSNDRQQRSATTNEIVSTIGSSMNFRIYWDGTLQDNLADGGFYQLDADGKPTAYPNPFTITRWNGSDFVTIASMPFHSCNWTKQSPNLSCDLFGDWREEVILHDDNNLYIYSSAMPTDYKVPCLLTDHIYRMGIVWQQSAYNQPPHLGYYLPDAATTINVKDAAEELFYHPEDLHNIDYERVLVGSGSVLWTLSDGQQQEAQIDDAIKEFIESSTLHVGHNFTMSGTAAIGDYTETKFTSAAKEASSGAGNAIDFFITLKDGYEFHATKYEYVGTRFATDGGTVNITWMYGDDMTKTIGSNITLARDNADPNFTKKASIMSNAKGAVKECGLRFNIYSLDAGKSIGLCNVGFTGMVKAVVPAGIREVNSRQPRQDNSYYTLQGIRVDRPSKGIYIHQGRKIVIK